jgi:parallel beta-helix repeat protein
VEIYNNTVKNFGIRNTGNQQAGIILGGLCNGRVYNNKVSNGSGTGIVVFGYNNCRVYNNIVSDVGSDGSAQGQDGIFIDDRPDPTYPGLQVFVMNNTIVRPKRHGIRLMNSNGTVISGNLIQNNLIVEPGIYASAPASAFVGISSNASATASFNLGYPNIATAQFINNVSDFRIAATSPAKDAGTNLSSTGILNDIIGTARPNGTSYDVGAYEYFAPNQPNQAPNANAGADITITFPTSTANLNGSLSNDPDGNITSYAWSKLSGPAQGTIVSPSSVTTTVNNLAAGVYQFVLIVTDAGNLTDKDTVQVTVNAAPNQAPNANAGADITIILPTNTATLNGSLSNDPDGTITTYAWNKLSGPAQGTIVSPTLASTAVNNLAAGVYQFVLTVTDNGGLTDKDTMQLIVNQPTGVNNVNQDQKSLQVFPNPVTDNCSIRLAKFETGEVVLRITDAWGRYIWQKVVMFSGRELILNESLGFLEKGTYTIICSDKNSRKVSQKIVKL